MSHAGYGIGREDFSIADWVRAELRRPCSTGGPPRVAGVPDSPIPAALGAAGPAYSPRQFSPRPSVQPDPSLHRLALPTSASSPASSQLYWLEDWQRLHGGPRRRYAASGTATPNLPARPDYHRTIAVPTAAAAPPTASRPPSYTLPGAPPANPPTYASSPQAYPAAYAGGPPTYPAADATAAPASPATQSGPAYPSPYLLVKQLLGYDRSQPREPPEPHPWAAGPTLVAAAPAVPSPTPAGRPTTQPAMSEVERGNGCITFRPPSAEGPLAAVTLPLPLVAGTTVVPTVAGRSGTALREADLTYEWQWAPRQSGDRHPLGRGSAQRLFAKHVGGYLTLTVTAPGGSALIAAVPRAGRTCQPAHPALAAPDPVRPPPPTAPPPPPARPRGHRVSPRAALASAQHHAQPPLTPRQDSAPGPSSSSTSDYPWEGVLISGSLEVGGMLCAAMPPDMEREVGEVRWYRLRPEEPPTEGSLITSGAAAQALPLTPADAGHRIKAVCLPRRPGRSALYYVTEDAVAPRPGAEPRTPADVRSSPSFQTGSMHGWMAGDPLQESGSFQCTSGYPLEDSPPFSSREHLRRPSVAPALAFFDVKGVTLAGCPAVGHTLRLHFGGVEPLDVHNKWWRITEGSGQQLVAKDVLSYTCVKEDEGCYIKVQLKDSTGDKSEERVLLSDEVSSGIPCIQDLSISGHLEPLNVVELSYHYVGSEEGMHKVEWFRITPQDWTMRIVENEGQLVYSIQTADLHCCLKVVMTPVTSAGISGPPATYVSEPVRSGPPVTLNCRLAGNMVEGSRLVAEVEVDYCGAAEGRPKIWWFRDEEPIPEARGSMEYTPTLADVDKRIAFKFAPVNGDNIEGMSNTYTADAPITPQEPTITEIKLENCFIGHQIRCVYKYVGGYEGRTELSWFRSWDGVAFTPVHKNVRSSLHTHYNAYESTADDLHAVFRCEVLPVRHDGRTGAVRAADALCQMSRKLRAEMQEILRVGIKGWNVTDRAYLGKSEPLHLLFTAHKMYLLWPKERAEEPEDNRSGAFQLKAIEKDQIICKSVWGDRTLIETMRDSSDIVRIDFGKEAKMLQARTAQQRLQLVLSFRIFQGMAMHDLCTEVMGADVAADWRKGRVNVDRKKQDELVQQWAQRRNQHGLLDNDLGTGKLVRSQAHLQAALEKRRNKRLESLVLPAADRERIRLEAERRGTDAWFMAGEALQALLMGSDDLN